MSSVDGLFGVPSIFEYMGGMTECPAKGQRLQLLAACGCGKPASVPQLCDGRASRGEPGRPFAIVCPGGGFSYVGAIHEGFPLAIALSRMGYNAFSIQYRTEGAQVACEDLAQAIDFIMRHGFGLGIGTTAEGWEKDAVRFWEKYISRKN